MAKKSKKFGKPTTYSRYSSEINNPGQKTSLISKIFGNQKKLDDARKSFFSPYTFESNIVTLRIISILLLISIILSLGMFFIERNNESVYKSWKYQGISSIPPSNVLNFDLVIDFSSKENFTSCNTNNPKKLLEGMCDAPIKLVNEMNSTQSRSQLLFMIQFIIMFALFFPLGSFFHRAVRNVKTLKYKSNISPEKTIVWIYFGIFMYFVCVFIGRFISSDFKIILILIILPFLFLSYRIFKAFKEIYRGSLLSLKKENSFYLLTNRFKIWYVLFFAVSFFNPSTITRLWANNSQNLNDLIEATKLMYFSSIILIIFCFFTIVLMVEIYKLQEIKNITKGSIEIDPMKYER